MKNVTEGRNDDAHWREGVVIWQPPELVAFRHKNVRITCQVERETGFEPATPCLEGRHSTTELLPL